ncbi:phosphatidyl-N-methylethanolamine N-methyltransferase-like [Orbicella faveolata]|uniref:phosphatidyl-N-methylethanolamine N-methyltransferase-like n=1 Tax=Orbicella faveolata TaxID=48498 RepID=UPI0009E44A1D|nr:phosphatidyl-N-methylethanolamine N-methyltransferase-like [Orbicella faveolata]
MAEQSLWCCEIFHNLNITKVAHWEFRTHALTHWFGSAERGCYALAVVICLLGLFRDYWFEEAISSQPIAVAMCTDHVRLCGTLLIVTGTVLVLSSTWSLGIIGTFLGDYFGLLLNKRVTGFPFNVMNNPMYWGSTMNFLGYSLRRCSPAGVLLTALVAVCYKIALLFEGPFTERIYAEKKLRQEKEE